MSEAAVGYLLHSPTSRQGKGPKGAAAGGMSDQLEGEFWHVVAWS